jgi:hypothetical protein
MLANVASPASVGGAATGVYQRSDEATSPPLMPTVNQAP